jgi:hypothetical protein
MQHRPAIIHSPRSAGHDRRWALQSGDMAPPSTPYDAICAAVMTHCKERTDGALLAVFLDRRATVALTIGFDEGTHHVDELFLRHLVDVVTDLRIAEVVFAVVRASGRPNRIDKLLWRELRARLDETATVLRDVVVVGDSQRWSAASGRTVTTAVCEALRTP